MLRFFLRFHDRSFEGFDWCVVDSELPVEPLNWQKSVIADLKVLLAQHAVPAVLIIPQQLVYLTEYELPEKASRQVLAAIEYQIEDQLAQDTELLHCALGEEADNKIPVAVVEQSIMEDCQSIIGEYGIRVSKIIPELFICPWFDGIGEVNLIESETGLILRYGRYQGLQCQPQLLESMLDLINRQVSITQLNCFLNDETTIETLKTGQYQTSARPLNATSLDLDNLTSINLQQRQFQPSSNWLKTLDMWKSVAALIVLTLGLAGFNRMLALDDMEKELEAIKTSQYELIRDYVGPQVTTSSNLKSEFIKLLQTGNSEQQQADFLSLLLDFSQARATFESIQIVKISYQQKRLSVDISSQKLNDVESLHAALNAKGLNTKLERLNIKPELVSGQFVLEASSNG